MFCCCVHKETVFYFIARHFVYCAPSVLLLVNLPAIFRIDLSILLLVLFANLSPLLRAALLVLNQIPPKVTLQLFCITDSLYKRGVGLIVFQFRNTYPKIRRRSATSSSVGKDLPPDLQLKTPFSQMSAVSSGQLQLWAKLRIVLRSTFSELRI